MPSRPARSCAAIARYGLHVASGGRNSKRAVSGRFAYFGIRIAALRFPSGARPGASDRTYFGARQGACRITATLESGT